HNVAKHYEVPVVLHTDHAAKKWLPWIDGLIEAGKEYKSRNGRPLFSSHMLDLSEEPLEENITISKKYFEKIVAWRWVLKSNWASRVVKKTVWTTPTQITRGSTLSLRKSMKP